MASHPALLLVLALGSAAADAQTPAPQLVVLVRDPSGQPVADAEGTLLCGPEHELPALAGVAYTGDATAVAAGRSDAQGLLRFTVAGPARIDGEPTAGASGLAALIHFTADGPPRAGGGLITTAAGLGALLPRLRPGQAQRIAVQPMAEVTTTTGTDEFVLWPRAHTLEHGPVTLPTARGTKVLLPAGSYEVWVGNEDGWSWQRLELVSGQRTLLQFPGPAQRLQSRGGVRIHPTDWPLLTLCEPGGECVLRGAALAAPLTASSLDDGVLVANRTLPLPPTEAALVWPPADAGRERREFAIATAAAGATLFSVQRTASGGWQVQAGDRVDADGHAHLPTPADGDNWLLLVAPEHAPVGRPWPLVAGGDLTLRRGAPLRVQAKAPNHDPAVDLLVEYVPAAADVATVRARSDGRGMLRFGPVTGPGTLFVSDPRYGNQQVELAEVPIDVLTIELEAGNRVHGRALLDDGAPAAGAVITLRDPSGRLRPAERAVVADPDGAFGFAGLPDDLPLVLFASMARAGHTWSGKRVQFAAGDEAIDVVLRDEDPRLLPR